MDDEPQDKPRRKKPSHVEKVRGRKQSRTDETVELPPSNSRIFRVAAGLAEWTQKEREWMQQHPKLQRFEDRLRAAFEEREGDDPDPTEKFVKRLRGNEPKGTSPKIG